jgi:hypothetical protein
MEGLEMLSWFKRNKKKTDKFAIRRMEIEKLEASIAIGDTFKYLGRNCIVTGHHEFVPYIGVLPKLTFDYCDIFGVIHSGEMSPRQFYSLILNKEATE